jgi:ABC-type phosphate transport system ATPase subunit
MQARRIADRTMILRAGKLVTIGPTKEMVPPAMWLEFGVARSPVT